MKTPEMFLFWKKNFFFINAALLQFDWRLVPNLYLNVKYEIVRKMSNV